MGYPNLATTLQDDPGSMRNALLPALPVPAYLCDAHGRITYYNERVAQLWGRHPILSSDAERYSGAAQMFNADGTPLAPERCWMVDVLRTGEPCEGVSIVVERPDGSRRHACAYGAAIRENGTVVGASAVLIDVTDDPSQAASAQALRMSEASLRGFFDTAAVGVVQVNAEGRFARVNDRYCTLTGYSREELLTMGPLDLTYPDDRDEDFERLMKALGDPTGVYHSEKRYVRKDGTPVWVHVAANFLRDDAGRPVQTAAIVMDINERKRAEAALHQADRRKDDFLATLAHELRNPLGPLQHAVELLRTQDIEDREWCAAVIERQVGQLTRLIDDLLDVSRITRDKLVLDRTSIDLADVLTDAAEACRPVLESHEQTLNVCAAAEPLHVEGDAVRLTQVFTNLLTNAAKFNVRPGAIELRAASDGAYVVASVADGGIGIAADDIERIFDKFYQSPRNADRVSGGLGIGLALVRRIVTLHDGMVEAHSAGPDCGSRFIVRLPRAPRPPAMADLPTLATESVRTRRVLVVDDNADAADLLGELLKVMGHDVAVAYDGVAAVERAAQFAPDWVFLDLGMPELDGFGACARMRELPLATRPQIVAMTGWGRSEDRARTEQAGFDGHLVKPVDRAALARLLSP